MVALTQTAEGIVLPVLAQPGARQNAIRGEQNGMLKVSVTQVAEKGKANQAILEVLATGLDLKRSQIELFSGPTQPHKKFLVRGLSVVTLEQRIAAALES
jgi:uncharacterized protein YggU (UPF0235/DUF167 family)